MAREILGWTQGELAKRADLDVMTVSRFERGAQKPYPVTREKIKAAFEAAGAEFAYSGWMRLPGVEIKKGRWLRLSVEGNAPGAETGDAAS